MLSQMVQVLVLQTNTQMHLLLLVTALGLCNTFALLCQQAGCRSIYIQCYHFSNNKNKLLGSNRISVFTEAGGTFISRRVFPPPIGL